MSTASPPDVEPGRVGIWTAFVYRLRSVQLVTRGSHAVFPPLGLPRPLEAVCPDKKAATPERRRRQGRGGALTVPPGLVLHVRRVTFSVAKMAYGTGRT